MLGLYFGGHWFQTKFGNAFGNVELDAALDEAHDWSAEATMNPVEEGAPSTDHVIEQSDKLRIKGFVTETPLVASEAVSGVVNGNNVDNRTQGIFDLLRTLIKERAPVTVYTQYRIYDDMILTNVGIPRSAQTGEALEFNVDFVHIRKVSTQMVDIPAGISPKKTAKSSPGVGKKAEPAKDAGKKQPETVVKPSSTLARVFN